MSDTERPVADGMTESFSIEAWGNIAAMPKLIEALAKAQLEFQPVKKSSSNPFFKSKYADLAEVIDATRPALNKHGLVIVQLSGTEEGKAIITSLLLHSAGGGLKGTLKLPVNKWDSQTIGAALTYARRFSYQGIAGVAAEDDDGNTATGKRVVAEVEEDDPRVEVAGVIRQETESEDSRWLLVIGDGKKQFPVKVDKRSALAKRLLLDYAVVLKAVPFEKDGRTAYSLTDVLWTDKEPTKVEEAPKSSPIAKKQASTKAAETLIDKSMLITLQTARKRVKIPDKDYYNMLGSYGYEHANEVRVIDLPKILNEINEYRLPIRADEVNLDAEPA